MKMIALPAVIRVAPLDIQVCVPKEWTDKEVKDFADLAHPCGTESGWCITRQGDKHLANDFERNQCAEFLSFCHVMLHA